MNTENNQLKEKRIYWLDICRSIAIASVVMCHSIEAVYHELIHMQSESVKTKIFAFSIFTLGRLGVLLFLFITGYLLLKKYDIYDSSGCINFWKKHLFSLLVTIEIWVIIYNVFLAWYQGIFSTENPFLDMLFLKAVDLTHVWYMPMVLGVYLFIPFLSNIMNMFENKVWIIVMGLIFAYSFCTVPLNIILTMKDKGSLNVTAPTFIGGYFGLYIMCGYFVKIGMGKKIREIYLILFGVIAYLLAVGFQVYLLENGMEYKIWYNSPMLFMCALSIFILLSKAKKLMQNRKCVIWEKISKSAFGIYLIHNLIIQVIKKYVNIEFFKKENVFCYG